MKHITKALLPVLFVSSSIFPMRQVTTTLLARTLKQSAHFHRLLCAKYSYDNFDYTSQSDDGTTGSQTSVNTATDHFHAPDYQQNVSIFSVDQEPINWKQVLGTDDACGHTTSYQQYKATNGPSKSIDMACHQLSDNAQAARDMRSYLDFVHKQKEAQEIDFANLKSEVSHRATHFTTDVLNKKNQIMAPCRSLPLDEILAQREMLVKRLESLEKTHESLMQYNPKLYCSEYKQNWTHADYRDSLIELRLKCDIEATKYAIQECTRRIDTFAKDYEHTFSQMSHDEMGKNVLSNLIAENESLKHSIIQTQNALVRAEKELLGIKAQQEAFENRSLWNKIKDKVDADHTKDYLNNEQERLEKRIHSVHKKFLSLCHKSKICDIKITCAQKVIEKLEQEALQHAQQAKNKAEKLFQDAGLSNDARTLIAHANVELIGLDKLSPDVSKEVVTLLERAAQEQKALNDPSCDKAIETVVQVADTACQAFAQGKTELGHTLISFGNSVLDCTVAFSKGFVHGACKSVQNNWKAIKHPVETLTTLTKGVIHIATYVLTHPICPITPIYSQEDLNSIKALSKNITSALTDIIQKLNDSSAVEICEKLGEKAGEFGTDWLIFDGALKGASIVKNVAVAETAIIIEKAEQGLAAIGDAVKAEIAALAESKQTLATTAEGFDVALNAKRADIAKEAQALHSEMGAFDKAKNTVKSEVTAVGVAEAFPNGKYVNNPKHHINSSNNINKPPINGQKALDNSIPFKTKGNQNYQRRIGVEKDYFVILDEHAPGEFHGHMRTWQELDKDGAMQKTLYNAGIIKNIKTGKM